MFQFKTIQFKNHYVSKTCVLPQLRNVSLPITPLIFFFSSFCCIRQFCTIQLRVPFTILLHRKFERPIKTAINESIQSPYHDSSISLAYLFETINHNRATATQSTVFLQHVLICVRLDISATKTRKCALNLNLLGSVTPPMHLPRLPSPRIENKLSPVLREQISAQHLNSH